jgi:hypothetical protein
MSTVAYAQLKENIEINVLGAGSFYSSKDFEVGFPQSTTPVEGKFRGYLSKPPSFGIPHESNDPTVTVFPISGALSNGEASGGLIFYSFGER